MPMPSNTCRVTHHDHVSAGDIRPHAVQIDQDPTIGFCAGAVAAGAEEVNRETLRHRLDAPGQIYITETLSATPAGGRSGHQH